MPAYLMPLIRSGVIRPCGPLSGFAMVRWFWPSIFRWLGLSGADRTLREEKRGHSRFPPVSVAVRSIGVSHRAQERRGDGPPRF